MGYNKDINNPNYKHGESKTRLYNIWVDMKNRCNNSKHKRYSDYGGRGISVCPEWTDRGNGFINFRDWALSNGYQEGLQINRIENNGNYEPNNCNWVTNIEQQRNRRNNILTLKKANEIRRLHKTGDYTQKELAEKYNTQISTINQIIHNKLWRNDA